VYGVWRDLVEGVERLAGANMTRQAAHDAFEKRHEIDLGLEPLPTSLERSNDGVRQEIAVIATGAARAQAPVPECGHLSKANELRLWQALDRLLDLLSGCRR